MFRGDRLKKLRVEKKLTQEELGEMIGLTKSAICFYEKSRRSPSFENIIDFMHIFNVSADYLIGVEVKIKTVTNDDDSEITMLSKEELVFLEELKKNKFIYDMLIEDPKRCAEVIKKKIG